MECCCFLSGPVLLLLRDPDGDVPWTVLRAGEASARPGRIEEELKKGGFFWGGREAKGFLNE